MSVKQKGSVSAAVRDKARKVLEFAKELAGLIHYSDDFSNALLAPTGVVAGTFPSMDDRQQFFKTKEYGTLWKLISEKPTRPPTGELVSFPPLEQRAKKRPGAKPA